MKMTKLTPCINQYTQDIFESLLYTYTEVYNNCTQRYLALQYESYEGTLNYFPLFQSPDLLYRLDKFDGLASNHKCSSHGNSVHRVL